MYECFWPIQQSRTGVLEGCRTAYAMLAFVRLLPSSFLQPAITMMTRFLLARLISLVSFSSSARPGSQKMGYTILPPEYDLAGLAKCCAGEKP
jgi:hypothetical protein